MSWKNANLPPRSPTFLEKKFEQGIKKKSDDQFDHLIINFSFVMQNDWKTANFARLYYPHFTTFRNETSEYY
jgi:hypothetical protein